MSLSVYDLSLLLKGETVRAGPCLSCSHCIPRASRKHTKSVLLNQVFVENAAIYRMVSRLSPGSCISRNFIHPRNKDSGSSAD